MKSSSAGFKFREQVSRPCRGFLKRFEFFYGILVQRASAGGFLKKLELTFYAILVQRASAEVF